MPVRVTTVLPADPEHLALGGIASFVRGFTKFAPPDFGLCFVGITTGSKPRPLGRWAEVAVEGRAVRFLPVMRRSSMTRGRMPIALAFTAGLIGHRKMISAPPSVMQFHRPGTAMPLLRVQDPKVRVVHLTTEQLRSAGSESRWRLLGPVLDRLEGYTFGQMDRIYVVNRQAAEDYRLRFPSLAARIEFVPNWVDDTIFAPVSDASRAAAREELFARLGLPPSRVVLFAGRLERQKHPELLIEAFARVATSRPAALLLAGDGGLLPAVRTLVAQLGIADVVRFLGPLPRVELARLMNASDCLAVSSAFETGPTIAYEALASGLPVAGTNVGQLPELIQEGVNGAVAAEREPASLAAAIDRVLSLPAGQARRAAADASRPYRATTVLAPLYEAHRRLAM